MRPLKLTLLGIFVALLPIGTTVINAWLFNRTAAFNLGTLLLLIASAPCLWLLMHRQVFRPVDRLNRDIEDAKKLFDEDPTESVGNKSKPYDLEKRFDVLIRQIKLHQQSLRESEEQLRLALATTQQGLYELDIVTGKIFVNSAYAEMLGYDHEEFTESVESWKMRLHPDDQLETFQAFQDYTVGLRPDYRLEFRLLSRDGSWKWIFSVGAIVSRDAQGKPLRMLGTHLDITDRKESEIQRRESDNRLSFALDAAGIGDWNMDLRTNIAFRSLQHDRCFGYAEAVPIWGYDTFLAHIYEGDRDRVDQVFMSAKAGKGKYDVEFRAVWPDGSIHWLLSKGRFYFDDAGLPYRVAGIQVDVGAHKLAEAALTDSESRYRLLFQNSHDGVLQTTTDGCVVSANLAACAMFGLSEIEICARGCGGLIDMEDSRFPAISVAQETMGPATTELYLIRGDGIRFEAEVSLSVYLDHDERLLTSMVIRDVTERKKAEADVKRLVFFDPLTGLPNRRLLIDRLKEAMEAAQRTGTINAVLFIDLDHFKYINDARGHLVGDAVLKQVGSSLRDLLREEDTLSRIGGDEFVVLIASLAEDFEVATNAAMIAAERIRQTIMQPITIDGQQYIVSGSIGVTLLPRYGKTTDDLLREADTAMYHAKKAGRNRIAFFELPMQVQVEERLGIERDLGQAIDSGQLEMVLQPQFDANRMTVGAELLMRWTHPIKGPLSPAIFIPIAEESGLMLELGAWVLKQGCNTQARIKRDGHDMPVSINISPYQFRQSDFVAQVQAAVKQSGADPKRLIFEITEGLLIEDVDETISRMHELTSFGVRFSIDDFGTGFSSLSYLKRLPIFELKIDKSFIRDMPIDLDDTAIVQSILSMAKHLHLRVVAEGVENRGQAAFLIAAGCDVLQGYLLSKPMPIDLWLKEQCVPV